MSVKISGFYDEVSSRLETQIELAAGLSESYICLRRLDGKNIAEYTLDEFGTKIRPQLEKHGIGISSLGSPIGKIHIDDENAFKKQLGQLRELVKIASACDCSYIRVFSFHIKPDSDMSRNFEFAVSKLKQFTEIAADGGITLIHENEKRIFGDIPSRCVQLYEAVNSPYFKLCFDASNYIQCGVEPVAAYREVKPYTAYYHVKDCNRLGVEVPLGMGQAHYDEILPDLVKGGYSGFLTLEPHTNKYAQLRKPMFVLSPVAALIKPVRYYNRSFRAVDKQRGIRFSDRITAQEAFIWQYDALKGMLGKIE